MRILIAEDDAALARFVRQGLQGEHYAVDVVEDGEQARAMGTEFDYDLVILDPNLPKLDGGERIAALRQKRPSLPGAGADADGEGESGRPGAMPRHRRQRLFAKAILFQPEGQALPQPQPLRATLTQPQDTLPHRNNSPAERTRRNA